MNATILILVNLSRSDAYVLVEDANGQEQFLVEVKAGTSARQAAARGQRWGVAVGSDSYKFTAEDKNRVYLIGSRGVYEVEAPRALAPDGGGTAADFDFPASGGGSWD